MAKILSVVSRAGLARFLDPVARALLRLGITPNAVTLTGTLAVCVGAIGFGARGHLIVAVLFVTVSCFTDLVDGAMARARGTGSCFGALLDSTMDRVADGAIFGSAAYWLASERQWSGCVAALSCLVLGQVVSYVKARSEGLGIACNVGIAERAERLILIGVGGLLQGFGVPHALEALLWVLCLLSAITVYQRIAHVYRQAT